MVDTPTCEKCGLPMELVESIGDLWVYRCGSCGAEGWVTLCPEVPRAAADAELCLAVVRWRSSRATVEEIGALRHLSPTAAAMPLADLVKSARQEPVWTLGKMYRSEAIHLRERASQLGLSVEWVSLPEDAGPPSGPA